jgi:hypothetical protein
VIDNSKQNREDFSEMQENLEEQQQQEEDGNADEDSDFEGSVE